MQSEERLKVLARIAEMEKQELWDKDVEDDPETIILRPDKVDYLGKKLSSKIKTWVANRAAVKFYEGEIKKGNFIIKDVVGIENFLAVKGGAFLTCNHFNAYDNYAVYRPIRKNVKKGRLYRVIREGNYTNFGGLYGFLFKNCNTLPLSSDHHTMQKFYNAVTTLLERGEKILIYPEQGMWWNYRKPRPMKSGAFRFAVKNKVPVIPAFITMEDTDKLDADGFKIQAYTIHYLPAIYPKEEYNDKQNIEYMRDANYEAWKELYEKVYGIPLTYDNGEKE